MAKRGVVASAPSEAALVVRPAARPLAISAPEVERAREFLEAARAPNTQRAYAGDWKRFESWCRAKGADPLPASPVVLAAYLSFLATEGASPRGGASGPASVATIERALVAISVRHKLAKLPSPRSAPEVTEMMAGIRRKLGTAPTRKKPVLLDTLRAMLRHLPDGIQGERDRALLTFGIASAMRRSELVAVRVEHLEEVGDGLRIFQPRSKVDQDGEGRWLGIAFASDEQLCPVRAVARWRAAARVRDGWLFRSIVADRVTDRPMRPDDVCVLVQRYVAATGLDPAQFGAHSLRAGFVTIAYLAGRGEYAISRQTGHRSMDQLREYIRIEDVFKDNPTKGLW